MTRGSAVVTLAVALAACSGSGSQGPAGPTGPAGPAGNADPTQVVVLGTAPQAGSFHVTGPVFVGSVETSRVTFGPGAAESLDAGLVAALTGGASADGLHTHAASALTGTLPAAALPPEAALLVSGKLPESVLPASVPLLDTGKLPASVMPATYAQAAEVYTKAESDVRYARQADLSWLSSSVAALQIATADRTLVFGGLFAPGHCAAISHGWSTVAVTVTAWERRAGRTLWVPWATWSDDGTTDAARTGTLTASSGAGTVALANDGNAATQWEATTGTAWVSLDLGRPRKIDEVRIRPSRAGSPDSTSIIYVQTSLDGSTWSPVGAVPFTCVLNSTCDQQITAAVGRVARYVRLDMQGLLVATLADLEVYGEAATISAQPDAVTICNFDAVQKELSVRVSR